MRDNHNIFTNKRLSFVCLHYNSFNLFSQINLFR
nr:MAG TPA: hypothetical protein [Caudoviricetes sp.]